MKPGLHLRQPHPPRGIALVVVMCAVFVLTILAAAFAYSMKVEAKLASNSDSDEQLLWLGRSGVELARYVLAQQMTIPNEPYDSLNQIWAGGPGGPGETNSALSGLSLDNYPVGNGIVSIKIVDLERKININTASATVLQQALTLMGVDAGDISVVSDSIQDWIDPDDAPRSAGAESDYYQALPLPYSAKNAPIDDMSELLLIRGITPEMYWGSNATNHPPSAFQHKLGFGSAPGQPPDYPFGLVDIFTPFSSGKININTADTNVLMMIPGVDGTAAAAIVQGRAGPDGVDGTEDDTPYRSVGEVSRAGVNGAALQGISSLCNTRSQTFEVHVTARIGNYQREYVAILFRQSPINIPVLRFYWK